MIVFDLDMTLLDHKTGQIPPSALEAIDILRKNHKIVIATGRDMDNYYSTKFRDMIKPDAIVHMNGTKVTVGNKLLYEHAFDKKLLKKLLTYCEAHGFSIGMTEGDNDYYIHPEIIVASDIEFWGECGRRFQDPWEMMNKNIRTLAFFGNALQVQEVLHDFPELRMPLFTGRRGADVIEKGFSKADGLRCLARYFGEKEDLSDSYGFGDSMNDFEMVKEVGTGIAMGNAIDELKAVADYVTTPIDEDGIHRACVRLGLIF